MSKKILLGLGTVLVVAAGVAALSAYEAHVINVTAHIENALSVDTYEIAFGTVFPQEYLANKSFTISLSGSFIEAGRVDDVDYEIKQKPKCICDSPEYQDPLLCPEGKYASVGYATHACSTGYHAMLDLCPFLSKLPVEQEIGDYGVPSYFHEDLAGDFCTEMPEEPQHGSGMLAKSTGDTSDTWTVDLKVPPVKGYVGQDWPATCADWVVPENERDYGCDFWIEVTSISLINGRPVCGNGIKESGEECDDGNLINGDGCSSTCTIEGICTTKPDVMQVLDRSNSIDAGELATLKTASKAFVVALNPRADGPQMGQTSFSTAGTLDQHLTIDQALLNAAIDGLANGGWTNLYDGISLANTELADPTYDRNDSTSPDFMVIITDGHPNRPLAGDPVALAEGAADAADAAGTIIYVVGIGSDVNADWLKNEIATNPAHYFGVANWTDLEPILKALGGC